ncbi:hypothetical protein D3C78_1132130 [compost metagenome]
MKSSRLRAYSAEASAPTWAGRLVGPTMITPFSCTTWSATVSGQLPPWAAARSMTTEPGFICATVSALSRVGALRPGISAVVMTISACLARSCTAWAWRCIQLAGIGRA